MEKETELAQVNFSLLEKNSYPGRLLVLGVSDSGTHLVQIYAIMGRSKNSQNRIFRLDGNRLFTEAADPTKVERLDLIIYNAMNFVEKIHGKIFVVSNGDQTDSVCKHYSGDHLGNLSNALANRKYEPDEPNYTPRITGIIRLPILHEDSYEMEIVMIRKARKESDACIFSSFEYESGSIAPGFGYFVSTYSGDGNPLPSFSGEPLLMPIHGNIEEVAYAYWGTLNKENRVSIAVRFIDIKTGSTKTSIINRLNKV